MYQLQVSRYILNKIIGTSFFTSIATIWIFLYLLIAMKKLYAQNWIKTILKYMALGFLFSLTVLITLIANMAWTALMMQ